MYGVLSTVEGVSGSLSGGSIGARISPLTFYNLADTTATPADVASGKVFHLANGDSAVGTYLYNWMGDGAEDLHLDIHKSWELGETRFVSWTPSTTAKTIYDSETDAPINIDLSQYEYMLRWRFLFQAAYVAGTTKNAAMWRQAIEIYQGIFKRPSDLANVGTGTFNNNACVTLYTCPVCSYYNSSSVLTLYYGASYGIYPSATACSFGSSTNDVTTATIKTPSISARCSNTYFSTTMGGKIDVDNSTIKITGDMFRFKRGSALRSMFGDTVALYNQE